MNTLTYTLIFTTTIAAIVTFVWRFSSRRHSLPCPVWLRWMVELDNPFTKTNRASFIVKHLNLQRGMHVLDAGCGPGRLTIPVAKEVGSDGRVVAMDIQPGMLDRVKTKAAVSSLHNIDYMHAGLGDNTLDSEDFDRALLVTVLGEIPDRAAALREIFNALKPGGILSITEVIFDPHFQRRSKVEELASTAGFREKAFWGNSIAYVLHLEKPY
jgi:ubiquinone/menaquinone biosynthesis C-methylase UbiE